MLEELSSIFDWFRELCGDRIQWEDKKLITGLARVGRARAVVIAFNPEQTPHPEAAFRKGIRMVKLAEKLGCPVLIVVGAKGERSPGKPSHDLIHFAEELFKSLLSAEVPVYSLSLGGKLGEIERLMLKAARPVELKELEKALLLERGERIC